LIYRDTYMRGRVYEAGGICVFHIIAEPNRRAILSVLVSSQQSVGEIERRLRMPQPTVSKHLRVLREAGFVESPVDAQRRLYRTTRVWPRAVLVNGEIVGVWRRSAGEVSIDAWRRLLPAEWEAIEAEALALPLPGLDGRITIHRS
jgi:DNA-binding transcriptional ArsR family regulator